jgi:hypothetical protein
MPQVLKKRSRSCGPKKERLYRCLRGCRAVVNPDCLVCPWCLLTDAKRADQAARLIMPEDWQKGTVGADIERARAMTKLRERDGIMKRIVTTTMTDPAILCGLLRSGLSSLLERACRQSPELAAWMEKRGVVPTGRPEPCSAGERGS